MDENQKYIIYGLVFPNEKIYIGQTNNFNKRLSAHKNIKESYSNKYLYYAIKKYGWENIQKEMLLECNMEYADFFERAFIFGYDSMNEKFGYNLESGGNKNKNISNQTKKKHSIARKGKTYEEIYGIEIAKKMINAKLGKKQTKEHIEKRIKKLRGHIVNASTKKKMSDARKKFIRDNNINMSGENNPWYGMHHSDDSKLKMSVSHTGKKLSDLHKMKLSENNGFGMKGKHHSDETKKKMSKFNCKEINMYDKDENFIKSFESCKSASIELNIHKSSIHRMLSGKYKYFGKNIFKYKENNNVKT